MLQAGSQMFPLWALGLVWLTCGCTSVCESATGANAASENDCYRKTCMKIEYDIREAVCCENNLHTGAGLLCCGEQSFNPAEATCCKEGHGPTMRALVTQGLSENVSACCGLKAYNPLNEICCQSTVFAKPAPKAKCCDEQAVDEKEQLCCGRPGEKTILSRKSSHHECCDHDQYNTKTQCCYWMNDSPEIQPINSSYCREEQALLQGPLEMVSSLCGQTAYNTLDKLCCQSTVIAKSAPKAQCCGHGQYDTETQCCCWVNQTFQIQPINPSCCKEESGVEQQKHRPQPNCSEPNTSLCGSSCYNPNEFRCCERNQTKAQLCCSSGRCDAAPTVYNPHTHICCDGCVSEREPWIDQCCGETPYGLAQRGVLCCNNTLYTGREDGEECSEISIPYNPAKGTTCCSKFHASPGQHCCGTEVYRPHAEICCNGHRHPKGENMRCCGVQAYNIKSERMKCCAGTLYNLTSDRSAHGDQCCGSILQKPTDVCCLSEDKEVLYSEKAGFSCCGHLYYNTSLWSCCAGKLSPVHQPGQRQHQMIKKPRLLSVNNLNETDLCEEMLIGTVESVSLHSIVFRDVVKIYGRNATVKHLPSTHILKTPDRCNFPKLIPGKTYFFKTVNVFTGFKHDFFLQSLHFIISKCYRP